MANERDQQWDDASHELLVRLWRTEKTALDRLRQLRRYRSMKENARRDLLAVREEKDEVIRQLERAREVIDEALDELGVATPEYPAPIANAVAILESEVAIRAIKDKKVRSVNAIANDVKKAIDDYERRRETGKLAPVDAEEFFRHYLNKGIT